MYLILWFAYIRGPFHIFAIHLDSCWICVIILFKKNVNGAFFLSKYETYTSREMYKSRKKIVGRNVKLFFYSFSMWAVISLNLCLDFRKIHSISDSPNVTLDLKLLPRAFISPATKGRVKDISVCACIHTHALVWAADTRLALFVNTTHVDELLLTSIHNTPRATEKTQ